jgi:hypothetical protein
MKAIIILALLISSLPLFAQDTGTNAVTTPPPVAQAAITNTITPFQQAVADYQQPPNTWVSAQNVAKLSATMDKLPPIPEEARKHFVMGATEFKEAKNTGDFLQAAGEFFQSSIIAPWWAEAWNNMTVSRESAGDYDYALNCLKVYQLFKLNGDEARAAQDLLYKIQAEKDLAAKHTADQQAADTANAQAAAKAQADADAAKEKAALNNFIRSIQGNWLTSRVHFLSIGKNDDGSVEITYFYTQGIAVEKKFPISNIKVTGSSLEFTDTFHDPSGYAYIENYKLSLDSGGHLVGTYDMVVYGPNNNLMQKLHDDNCRFDRQ